MVLLTIQMSQYYEGTPNIPKYIFLLEVAQRKAARACLPISKQTFTILASTALLAADTFPRTTELWEELDPADKTWAACKTAYLAAHKKRANRLRATGGADYLGRANSAHTTTLNLASTALLAADTFPPTTELWEELDPASQTQIWLILNKMTKLKKWT
jgi:hypothetical protein